MKIEYFVTKIGFDSAEHIPSLVSSQGPGQWPTEGYPSAAAPQLRLRGTASLPFNYNVVISNAEHSYEDLYLTCAKQSCRTPQNTCTSRSYSGNV